MRTSAMLLALLCAAALAQAQTAYRWVDRDGKVHYGDRPPPPEAARELREQKLAAPAATGTAPSFALRQAMENFPVVLYVGANCAACQQARDLLKQRGVPHREQMVGSAEEIAALSAKLGGGDAAVPSLQVGTKTSKGFLAPAWHGLLDAAGYPKAP